MVLADSPFVFDTSQSQNYNKRMQSGPRSPRIKKMIWAEESRAEMVLGRNNPAVRRGQSFHTRPYGSAYGSP